MCILPESAGNLQSEVVTGRFLYFVDVCALTFLEYNDAIRVHNA
jgi:hypothetical protein